MQKWLVQSSGLLPRHALIFWRNHCASVWYPPRTLPHVLRVQYKTGPLRSLHRSTMELVWNPFYPIQCSENISRLFSFVPRQSKLHTHEVRFLFMIHTKHLFIFFFSCRIVTFCLEKVCKWIHSYLIRQKQGDGAAVFKIRAHSAFYAACHIPFYVIAARHSEFLGNRKRKSRIFCINIFQVY